MLDCCSSSSVSASEKELLNNLDSLGVLSLGDTISADKFKTLVFGDVIPCFSSFGFFL